MEKATGLDNLTGGLQRINQFDGKKAGFLREILGPGPIASLAGIAGLGQEASYFFDQVELRGAKPLVIGMLEISFRDTNVVIRFMGVSRLIVR